MAQRIRFKTPVRFVRGVGVLVALALASGFFRLDVNLAATPVAGSLAIVATAGSGEFGAPGVFPVDDVPNSIALADLNGDGFEDMVVLSEGRNRVSVLLGLGDGQFAPQRDFATEAGPSAVAISDLNGDGKPDLVVTAHYGFASAGAVSVLLGNGDGTFGPKTDFVTGAWPIAVAIGDLNGDGKADVVTANHLDGTISVLLGNGTGALGPHTDVPAGDAPTSIAIGRLNADEHADVVVAKYGYGPDTFTGAVSVLLGNGNGSFQPATDFATGDGAIGVAVGDLNGDGVADLAVANNADRSVSVLLGDGAGGFGARTDFGAGTAVFAVAIGDLNGDGMPDLAVANKRDGSISVLLGAGGGSFGARSDVFAGDAPVSIALGDVNGDGVLDLAVANAFVNPDFYTASVLLGLGGSIAPAGVSPVATGETRAYRFIPESGFVVGDVRVDGVSQGQLANYQFTNISASHTISASFIRATPHLRVAQATGGLIGPGGTHPFGPVVVGEDRSLSFIIQNVGGADLTGLDVTIDGIDAAMFTLTSLPVSPVSGPTGATGFTVRFAPTATGPRAAALHIASNDASASPFDIALTGTGVLPVLVVEQSLGIVVAAGSVQNFGTVKVGSASDRPFTIRNAGSADLLGLGITIDGPDAALFSVKTSPVSPVKPGGSTTLIVRFAPAAAGDRFASLHLTSNDAAHSPFDVLLVGAGAAAEPGAGPGEGSGSGAAGPFRISAIAGSGDFGAASFSTVGDTPESVAAGDVNGDGIPDLVTANAGTSTITVLLGLGDGQFGPRKDFATGDQPFAVALGDVDGDGRLDAVVANLAGGSVSVLLNDGDGRFGPKTDYPAGGFPFALAVGDLNGDGKADIAVGTLVENKIAVLLNDGAGSFGAATEWPTGESPASVVIADLNADGKADIVASGNASNTVTVLLGAGDGTFAERKDIETVCPFGVAVGDVDGDGRLDLAVANNCSATVTVLLGTGDGTFGPGTEFGTGLGPGALALGHVNGDGVLDLARFHVQIVT